MERLWSSTTRRRRTAACRLPPCSPSRLRAAVPGLVVHCHSVRRRAAERHREDRRAPAASSTRASDADIAAGSRTDADSACDSDRPSPVRLAPEALHDCVSGSRTLTARQGVPVAATDGANRERAEPLSLASRPISMGTSTPNG